MSSSDPVVVYTTDSLHQAQTLAMLLKADGIQAFVLNADIHTFSGIFQADWAAPRVAVPGDQVAKAAELVREFEAKQLARPPAMSLLPQNQLPPPENADDDEHSDRTIDAQIWPKCPECNTPRPTQCPFCKHTGSDFLAAYRDSEDERSVVCPTCDEPFQPIYHRICHNCGHDYGDGKQLSAPRPAVEDVNWRVPIVIIGVLAVLGLVMAYFYYVVAPKL